MDWQSLVTIPIVGLAAWYVIRHVFTVLSQDSKGSCGSCSSCPTTQKENAEFVSLDMTLSQD